MADAIRSVTRTDLKTGVPAALFYWTGLDSDDSGEPIEIVDYVDKTVTFSGTFGTGGSITLQGSNDNSNWFSLTDPQGNAITKTAAGMELVTENPRYIRPIVTAGDGTTSLSCRICAVRGTR